MNPARFFVLSLEAAQILAPVTTGLPPAGSPSPAGEASGGGDFAALLENLASILRAARSPGDAQAQVQGEAGSTLFGVTGGVGNPPNIALAASSAGAGLRWAASLGIEAADVDLDITKFTQFAASSTVASINPDGAPVGNVVGVEVAENGRVSPIFDNNLIRLVAQIRLATFANPDGLEAVGGNAYVRSTELRRVFREAAPTGRRRKDPVLCARSFDRRPFCRVHRTDHHAKSLLGLFKDHHHRRSDARGVDQY